MKKRAAMRTLTGRLVLYELGELTAVRSVEGRVWKGRNWIILLWIVTGSGKVDSGIQNR